jgi:restriction system protein
VRGRSFPLFEQFDGELLYYPEIVPITLNFGRMLCAAKSNPTELFHLSPRHFEELVTEIWRRFGYGVELTSQTRDGGRDIIAVKEAEANVRFLIECKRYERRREVGVQMVRSLYGVKVDECATKAILATTSSFSSAAKEFFQRHIWELEPRDYDGVVQWIKLATDTNSL